MPTLNEIQIEAQRLRTRNGWPQLTAEQRFVYLVEEIGEVARALQDGRDGVSLSVDAVADELYDVVWNACDLASILGINLDIAAVRKAGINRDRTWP